MTLNPGDRLKNGCYEIQDCSRQRNTITYEAIDCKSGQRVTIKTLSDSTKVGPDATKVRRDFFNEISKLSKLKHDHIVPFIELFEEDSTPYLVMEYIVGDDLHKMGQLPERQAIHYIRQIGKALDYIHGEKVIHRDVRPANIRLKVGEPATAVLIDFGSALNFEDKLSAAQTASHASGYAAPEAYTVDGDRGSYTDIYSLGATLYRLLEGKAPPDALERQLKGVAISFSGQYDAKICQLIEKAMALKPADRPKSATEWLKPFSQEVKQQPPFSLKGWNWQTIAAVIAAIGGLLAGFGAMGWFKNEPPTPPAPVSSPIQSPAQSTNSPIQSPAQSTK